MGHVAADRDVVARMAAAEMARMAMSDAKPLADLLGEIARRRRRYALARVIAWSVVALAALFFIAAWADAKWSFPAWMLGFIDVLIVIELVVAWRLLRHAWIATRPDAVATAAAVQHQLGLRHSELTNAVELACEVPTGNDKGLWARAISLGDTAVVGVDVEKVAPPRPMFDGVLFIVMGLFFAACALLWPGQTRATALRLACPWSDEPAYSGLTFVPHWFTASTFVPGSGTPRPVEVAISSKEKMGGPSLADIVWIRRGWWGGLGDEISRMPLRRMESWNRFEGCLYGEPQSGGDERVEYFVATDRGRSRVFTLPPQHVGLIPVKESAEETQRSRNSAAVEALIGEVALLTEQWRKLQSGATAAQRAALQQALRAAADHADAAAKWKRDAEVETAAGKLAEALRAEAELTKPQTGDGVATTQTADAGGEARMESLRQKAAALASAIARLSRGEEADLASGKPASGTGDGPGVGAGGSHGDLIDPGYSVRSGESGVVTAATTLPTGVAGDSASSLLDVPLKYREIAADYLRRVASDRATATRPR
jgi:hypothetical protein